MNDIEIYTKAVNRINKHKNHTLEEIIIELEKEIDEYRKKIYELTDDKTTWFKVNQNTSGEQLYKFLLGYVPMGEVITLYQCLKKSMEV